jgi:3'-5' exoribonuclease
LPESAPPALAQLDANQLIEGVYMIQNCQMGRTRNGKPFLKCLLRDRTAQLAGRMWNVSEETFKALPTDGFVRMSGQSQPYQGQIQIIIEQIEGVEPSEQELENLLPSAARDPDEMLAELREVMASLTDPALRSLANAYLDDEGLMARFRRAPAAQQLHHARLGGLLEHTLELLHLAKQVCPRYSSLNQELVLMGLFLHDLGKCAELTWERGFGYTADGQLVGHIARGVLWLQRKADHCSAQGHPIPDNVLRVLHHILLSHHGEPEHGALKAPATPEALAVHLIDNLDAKMSMALEATRDTEAPGAADFTERLWALANTRFYRPDPTAAPEAGAPDA